MTATHPCFLMFVSPTGTPADWSGFGRATADLLAAAFEHLAWPTTVLVLALLFRSPIVRLLDRVEGASSKYGKLTLGTRRLLEKLGHAEAMANALSLPPAIAPGRSPADSVGQAVKQCLNAAAKQPGRAINDGWQLLVDSTCDLVEAKVGKRPSTTEWIASASGFVDSGLLQVINLLMSIQSEELLGGSVAVQKDEAVRYINRVSRTHRRMIQGVQPSADQALAKDERK